MKKYTIGLDFGTLSARALLLDLETGEEVTNSEFIYPHAILQPDFFPNRPLNRLASLEHPQDYLDALKFTVPDVLAKANVKAEQVCGLGMDFTACSVLPVDAEATPLCFQPEFAQEPHAYVKLWNSYSAQEEATLITQTAKDRNEPWLKLYSNKVSAEWLYPKLLENLHNAPALYEKTAYYLEAGDWLTWMLTGNRISSASFAGFKALWSPESGFPSNEFWAAVDPRLDGIIGTKVNTRVGYPGEFAGRLSPLGQALTGLTADTAVALPIIDAHAPACSTGAVEQGQLLLSLGTSAVFLIQDPKHRLIDGIFGIIQDGILPGLTAYETQQASLGNTLAWFMKNCLPESYAQQARAENKDIFHFLDQRAQLLPPGSNGLLLLDWWNGNRFPYNNFDLSGMILGLTLKTKPEEIYRAIMECCAYATRMGRDMYRDGGVEVREIRACGGISRKNPMLMQIYADVLGAPIRVADSVQAVAKGSAIFAAVASGEFPDLYTATRQLSDKCEKVYIPNPEQTEKYDKLYQHYLRLCRYFAEGDNPVMRDLRQMTE